MHAHFIGEREDAAGLPSLDHLAHALAFVVEEGDWNGHRASVVIRVFHFHQVGGGRVWQFDLIGKPGERGRPIPWNIDLLDFRAGAVVAFAVFAGRCLVDPRLAVRLEKLGGINRLPHVRIGNAIDVVDQGFALDPRVRPGLDVHDRDLADAELARAQNFAVDFGHQLKNTLAVAGQFDLFSHRFRRGREFDRTGRDGRFFRLHQIDEFQFIAGRSASAAPLHPQLELVASAQHMVPLQLRVHRRLGPPQRRHQLERAGQRRAFDWMSEEGGLTESQAVFSLGQPDVGFLAQRPLDVQRSRDCFLEHELAVHIQIAAASAPLPDLIPAGGRDHHVILRPAAHLVDDAIVFFLFDLGRINIQFCWVQPLVPIDLRAVETPGRPPDDAALFCVSRRERASDRYHGRQCGLRHEPE